MDVPVAYAFAGQIDFEQLHRGLENTLNRIPSVAGRLVDGASGLEITNLQSPGCVLEFTRSRQAMPHKDEPCEAWAKYFHGFDVVPLEPFGKPLLKARLTHCEQGSVLAISLSHLVADGDALVQFIRMWSYETGLVRSRSSRLSANPVHLAAGPPSPECSRAVPPAVLREYLPISEEFREAHREGHLLSFVDTLRFLTSVPLAMAFDEVADFVFSLQEWNAIKARASQGLHKGEWVSSYEAVMAAILQTLAKVDHKDQMAGRAVVNLRGRSKYFAANYFGVGLATHDFVIGTNAALCDVARDLHESLRSGLADLRDMEKLHTLAEDYEGHRSGRFTGMVPRTRLLTQWKKALLDEQPVINSWVSYPWFDCSFGLPNGERPLWMRVPQVFRFRRHVHVFPRSDTEFQLRMQLPRAQMREFKRLLREGGLFGNVASSGDSVIPSKL
jgi:hypothetical protein